MSKLDDILNELKDYIMALVKGQNPATDKSTKQQIKDLMLELIGEDTHNGQRNIVRRELRKKVKEL